MAIDRNPFDVLGLPTGTSPRDIRRRLDELTMQVGLGLAPDGIDEPQIRSMRQVLEDPIERFTAELTWLLWKDETPQLPPMSSDSDLQMLSVRLWQAHQSASPPDRLIIGHDLAIVDLERFARNRLLFGTLTQALNNWQATVQSADFWRLMGNRAEARGDARLNAQALGQIRDALPEHVLSRAFTDVGAVDADASKKLLEAVKTSTASDSMKERATSYLTSDHQGKLLEAVQALREAIQQIPRGQVASQEAQAAVNHALSVFRANVIPRLNTLNSLGSDLIGSETADDVARLVSRLGEWVGYHLQQSPNAIAIMDYGIAVAKRPSVIADLASDEARLKRDYFIGEANRARQNHDTVGEVAFLELAATYCDPQERQELENQARQIRVARSDLWVQEITIRKTDAITKLQSGSYLEQPASPPTHSQASTPKPFQTTGDDSTNKRILVGAAAVAACFTIWAIYSAFLSGGEANELDTQSPRATATAQVASRQATRTPQPRYTPTAKSDEQFAGKRVYSNDFDRSSGVFEPESDADSRVYYSGNALAMGVSRSDLTSYYLLDRQLPESFSLSIDMEFLSGSNGSGNLVLGEDSLGDPVLFVALAWSDGEAWWQVWDNKTGMVVKEGTVKTAADSPVNFEVRSSTGTSFRVYVDGKWVGSFQHYSPDIRSKFGFGVGKPQYSDVAEVLVKFDNLEVYDTDG